MFILKKIAYTTFLVAQLYFTFSLIKCNYSQEYKKIADQIRTFYFGQDGQVNADTVVEFNDLMSDVFFVYHIDEAVKLQANKSSGKTYYYR